jgi:Holliday junction resolvase RusA-like endonuclease
MTTRAQWFVLPLNPVPWAVGPLGIIRKAGRFLPYMGRNQELHDFKVAVARAVKDQNPVMIRGKVKITCIFWRDQEEYKTPQARTARKNEADTTNLLKATEDALQGIVYENDKDNNEVHGYIAAQAPGIRPRMVICVEPNSDIPEIVNHLPQHVYDMMDKLNRPDLFDTSDWYVDGDADPRRHF